MDMQSAEESALAYHTKGDARLPACLPSIVLPRMWNGTKDGRPSFQAIAVATAGY
jgi:hypothetical protein